MVSPVSSDGPKCATQDDQGLSDLVKTTPKLVYLLTVLSAIGGFLFGYDTGVVSGAMLLIREAFNLDDTWHEAIVSATIGAAWIFALVGGFLADKLGRKPTIIIASIVFTGGAVIMGVARSKEILLVGRIIVGIGIGLASMSVPLFIAEVSPPEVRGRLVTLNNIFITGGQFVASILCGAFVNVDEGWRYMLGLAGVPSLVQLVGMMWMPESPRWLMAQGRLEEARAVLRRTRGGSQAAVDEEIESIRITCEEDQACKEDEGQSSYTIVRILTSTATRRALVLGCVLQMYQQISGINTVMYYSASIIRMAGVNDNSMAIWLAAGVAAVNFVFTFVGLYLVERAGRRKLTLGSLAGVVVALVFLAVGFQLSHSYAPLVQQPVNGQGHCSSARSCSDCTFMSDCGYCYESLSDGVANSSCLLVAKGHEDSFSTSGNCSHPVLQPWVWAYGYCPSQYSWIIVVALCVYLFFFAPGMGPMPWTINSEIYPLWARSTCTSVATSVCWMFNLLVSMTFLSLTGALTQYGAFYLYAFLASTGFVVLYLLLPETKGVSLEDMEVLFSQSWCCPGANLQRTESGSLQETRRSRDGSQGQAGDMNGHASVDSRKHTQEERF